MLLCHVTMPILQIAVRPAPLQQLLLEGAEATLQGVLVVAQVTYDSSERVVLLDEPLYLLLLLGAGYSGRGGQRGRGRSPLAQRRVQGLDLRRLRLAPPPQLIPLPLEGSVVPALWNNGASRRRALAALAAVLQATGLQAPDYLLGFVESLVARVALLAFAEEFMRGSGAELGTGDGLLRTPKAVDKSVLQDRHLPLTSYK
jgi:hypothetical protein